MVLLENRNQSIDCVKIVAMFGVMALHTCLSRTNELPGFVLSRMFGLSIPLFFMVSGYLMHGRVIDYKYVFQKIFMILRFTFLVCLIIWFLEILRHDFSWISFPKIWIGSFLQRGPMNVFWYFGAMIMIYAVLPLYNYLEQNNHNFLMHFTIILTCISFIAFIADYSCSFESNYIPQPFRLWYWLLYFSIGQLIKKTVLVGGVKIRLLHILIYCALLLMFVYSTKTYIKGIEYFFGSVIMIVYSFSVFKYIISKDIQKNDVISVLSSLFLPCYAIHMFVIAAVKKLNLIQLFGVFSTWIDYILVLLITLSISYVLMRIPYIKQIFRI